MRHVLTMILFSFVMIYGFVLLKPYTLTPHRMKYYPVFIKNQGECLMYYEVNLYEDEENIYYFPFSGCNKDDAIYIYKDFEFISVKQAIEEGILTKKDIDHVKIIKIKPKGD